jgi:hypothetical protein
MRNLFWFLLGILVVVAIATMVRVAGASEIEGRLPNVFYVDELPKGCEEAAGCIFLPGDDIYISSRLLPVGKTFTLYHELCHWLLQGGSEDVCWDVAYNLLLKDIQAL